MLTEAEIEDITGDRYTPLWIRPPRLITEVREEADKAAILRSKEFLFRNPNIIPGVYSVEEADYEPGWTGRKAAIRLRLKSSAKVTHNGSERPINSWLGQGQIWWWRLHTQALIDAGFPVSRPRPEESPERWRERNHEEVMFAFRDMERRPALVEALMKGIIAKGIDVLGQGGEWVVINQSVIDWDRTMAANGGTSQPPRKKKTIADRQTDVIDAVEAFARSKGVSVGLAPVRPASLRITAVLSGHLGDEPIQGSEAALREVLNELRRQADAQEISLVASRLALVGYVDAEDVVRREGLLSDYGFTLHPDGWRWSGNLR